MSTAIGKTRIHTPVAPKVGGPYSQAIVANGLVFCAGQLPIDPATGGFVEGGIQEQTHRVLQNLEAVLHAAGTGLYDAVKTTVFLADLADFGAMNEVYARYFGDTPPARSTVQVAALRGNARVEIECVALLPGFHGYIAPAQAPQREGMFDLDEDREF